MINLSISDLNRIQYDEKFTGSVKALRKQAGCARLIKPLRCHHDDDPHFTGRMVNHYKKALRYPLNSYELVAVSAHHRNLANC